jgi:putative FmdB family regulatory protein
MPTYHFKCPKCGFEVDVVQRMTETTNEIACIHCGGEAVKVIEPSSFHLSGSGWSVQPHEKFDRRNGRVRKETDYRGTRERIESERDRG